MGSTTRNFTSTFAGDALKKYILQALVGGETLSTKGINIESGIKYKRTIKKFASSGIVTSGGCDFSASGTLTITEGVLEPQKMKVNVEICFEDLYNLWDAESMASGMNNENVPGDLATALNDDFIGRAAESVEFLVWSGDTTGATGTYLDVIDGYFKLLDNGSPQTVTATTVTATNAVAEFNKVLAKQPAAIANKPAAQKVLFVSSQIALAYQQNLASQGVRDTVSDQPLTFMGIEVRPVGYSANRMVLGLRNNFYVGTDLESDYNELKVIDMRDTTGDDLVRYIMKFKTDVAIGLTAEVVYYS